MNIILKLKHWQLFIMVVGPLIVKYSITPSFMVGFALHMLHEIAFFIWMWAIVTGLNPKVPNPEAIKVTRFKIIAIVALPLVATTLYLQKFVTEDLLASKLYYLLFFLWLGTLVTVLLTIRAAAKTLKSIEIGRVAKLDEYATVFFGMLFYPVGIWFVQPRINAVIK